MLDPLWLSGRGTAADAALQCFVVTSTPSNRADLLLVCSTGGHLLQLVALRDSWQRFARAWVTFDKSDARSLLEAERVYYAHGPTNRNLKNMLRNLLVAWRVVAEVRPKVVVTTGAGVAVPFAWVARLRGAKVVYVESMARIEGPSLTYRLIAPIASRRYVQWPELARGAPPCPLCRQRLLGGRMIFVSVGTNEARFDRLLRAVAGLELDEELVVQHGHSARIEQPGARARRLPLVRADGGDDSPSPRRRHARRRRLGDGLARKRQVPGRRPAPEVARGGRRRPPASARPAVRRGRARDARRGGGRASLPPWRGEQQAAAIVPTASSLAADLTSFLEHAIPRPLAPAPA